jgi:hypothetical protein
MTPFLKPLFLSFFLFSAFISHSLDSVNLWRHPEIADKYSVFFDVGPAPLKFKDFDFPILPVVVRLDFLAPFPLPFSIGAFFNTPHPNFKNFGLRLAYHFDLLDDSTDLYFLYSFDFGFLRNDVLKEYNDTPVDLLFYDFRAGIRYFFSPRIGLALETDSRFEGLVFLLSLKIN